VALVLTARSGDSGTVEERLLELERDAGAIPVRPASLGPRAVRRLVRERFAAEPADAFADACLAATGGNPLFLAELMRELEAREVAPHADAAHLVATVGPRGLARLTLARVAAIGPGAAEIAKAVAVLGDGVEPTVVAAVTQGRTADVVAIADRLVAAGILLPERRLGFVHPILRAAIYERMPPGERAVRHARVAQHLARSKAPAERVAAHLLLAAPAGDTGRVATLTEAARTAVLRGSARSAAQYLRRALEEPPPDDRQPALLLELGRIEHDIEEHAAAEEHLTGALRAADVGVRADAAR